MDLDKIAREQPKTELLYLRQMSLCEAHGRVLKVVREKGSDAYLVLNKTIFHPKGGGQPSDRGLIYSSSYQVTIKKAIYHKGVVIHWAKIMRGQPVEGEVVSELDWQYRYLVMRRHTAAHLIDHCLAQVTKARVQTTDSWLDQPCYVGYKGSVPSGDVLEEVEALANGMIHTGGSVDIQFLDAQTAHAELRDAPNFERLPDITEIRTVGISGCSPIPCGGTHVSDIREIEGVSISRPEPVADGSFRLHFSVAPTASFCSS